MSDQDDRDRRRFGVTADQAAAREIGFPVPVTDAASAREVMDLLSQDPEEFAGRLGISTVLRVARQNVGISQVELAQRVGVTPAYIGNIERGREVPTNPETIVKLAAALDIDPDRIYAAIGRVPADLVEWLGGDIDAIKATRRAMDEVT